MGRAFNKISEERLIKAAQSGVKKEVARKLAEGKPVSCYDPKQKRVYRLTVDGKRNYV